jgi:hypothetical protein
MLFIWKILKHKTYFFNKRHSFFIRALLLLCLVCIEAKKKLSLFYLFILPLLNLGAKYDIDDVISHQNKPFGTLIEC